MPSSPQWVFDRFRLDPDHACLWHGARCRLTPKAFDLLHYFVPHPHRVYRKMNSWTPSGRRGRSRTWCYASPSAPVRKVLGETAQSPRFIATVSRRGYRFLGPVTAATPPEAPQSNLPRSAQRAPLADTPPRPSPSRSARRAPP